MAVLAIIGVIVLIAWLLGLVAFHVTAWFIHIALVIGIILIVLHFVNGGRTRAV